MARSIRTTKNARKAQKRKEKQEVQVSTLLEHNIWSISTVHLYCISCRRAGYWAYHVKFSPAWRLRRNPSVTIPLIDALNDRQAQ
eukprot:3407405-Pleurochrysis_carterae.AAC.2